MAADGVTWLDSYGAVVKIKRWANTHPFNPPYPYIILDEYYSAAFDNNGINWGYVNSDIHNLILCASKGP